MSSLFSREPVLILGALQAILALLAAFALPLSGDQVGAIMAAAAAILAVITRTQVSPAVTAPEPPVAG